MTKKSDFISTTIRGRGAGFNPSNRFEELHVEPLVGEDSMNEGPGSQRIPTKFYIDSSKSLLSANDSPDLGFSYSINPYRGCEHGCVYCYARPSHEYLGFSSGIDFESKIMVKLRASALLAECFQRQTWQPQVVALSGNTDCYQPVERRLELTRKCLEVFLEFRNPVLIITKNALVLRDVDLLKQLSLFGAVSVTMSITTLDPDLARIMEPRTSSPVKRLEAIGRLSDHGIRAGVLIAPVIPGLTDEEIPSILREASSYGARFAGFTMLRLPYSVKDLFQDWLERMFPDRSSRVLNRIRDVRRGKLNDSAFGNRMSGQGPVAESIKQLFASVSRKYFPDNVRTRLDTSHFRRRPGSQISLFSSD